MRLLTPLALCFLLAACGQSGALYLPKPPPRPAGQPVAGAGSGEMPAPMPDPVLSIPGTVAATPADTVTAGSPAAHGRLAPVPMTRPELQSQGAAGPSTSTTTVTTVQPQAPGAPATVHSVTTTATVVDPAHS